MRVLVCPVHLRQTYTWPLATCPLWYNIHIMKKKHLCIRKISKKTLIESKKYELVRDVDTLVLALLTLHLTAAKAMPVHPVDDELALFNTFGK
jgi:hypothetical protein